MKKVIAAIKNESELDAAIEAKVELIFDLSPDLHNIKQRTEKVHSAGAKLFIHMDFATGIGKDRSGIIFVKEMGVDGILSTRLNIIRIARDEGVSTIQRFFLLDSQSVETMLNTIASVKADMIEVMPGIMPKLIGKISSQIDVPIIAGGLVDTKEEVEDALNAGAYAISTGKKELWG